MFTKSSENWKSSKQAWVAALGKLPNQEARGVLNVFQGFLNNGWADFCKLNCVGHASTGKAVNKLTRGSLGLVSHGSKSKSRNQWLICEDFQKFQKSKWCYDPDIPCRRIGARGTPRVRVSDRSPRAAAFPSPRHAAGDADTCIHPHPPANLPLILLNLFVVTFINLW